MDIRAVPVHAYSSAAVTVAAGGSPRCLLPACRQFSASQHPPCSGRWVS
jgi:hypothetical protein